MRHVLKIGVPALLFSGLLLLSPVKAQQPTGQYPRQHGQAMPQPGGTFDFDKMAADMKASDARLQTMTMQMKSAQGEAKVMAMQDVVSELVTNQLKMHQHMMMMHDTMMGTGTAPK